MSRREDGNLDYVVVKGKLPKRDKDGNDISVDKLGTGGYRKEDGSLLNLVRDLEIAEDKDDEPDDSADQLRQYALADISGKQTDLMTT